ncbi:M3 family metallopeptidase [Nocardia sp. NPDC047648]|uniref:M3 family metallopeptidase n=1 Tax=Nocardia sp. NPDC047648 TaxID=3155625 RepID=UPI0033C45510
MVQIPDYFPDWLTAMVLGHFPEGDPEAMRRSADTWSDAANGLVLVLHRLQPTVEQLEKAVEGETGTEVQKQYRKIIDQIRAQIEFNNAMARQLYDNATAIEYQQYVLIGIAGALLAQVIIDMAMPPPGSIAKAIADRAEARVGMELARRDLVLTMLTRAARFVSEHPRLVLASKGVFFGTAIGGGVPYVAQRVQIAQGHRKAVDWQQVRIGAAAGAVGGLVGVEVGRRVAPVAMRVGGRVLGTVAAGGVGGMAGGLAGGLTAFALTKGELRGKDLATMVWTGFGSGLVGSLGASVRAARAGAYAGVPEPVASADSGPPPDATPSVRISAPGDGRPPQTQTATPETVSTTSEVDAPRARRPGPEFGDGSMDRPDDLTPEMMAEGDQILRDMVDDALARIMGGDGPGQLPDGSGGTTPGIAPDYPSGGSSHPSSRGGGTGWPAWDTAQPARGGVAVAAHPEGGPVTPLPARQFQISDPQVRPDQRGINVITEGAVTQPDIAPGTEVLFDDGSSAYAPIVIEHGPAGEMYVFAPEPTAGHASQDMTGAGPSGESLDEGATTHEAHPVHKVDFDAEIAALEAELAQTFPPASADTTAPAVEAPTQATDAAPAPAAHTGTDDLVAGHAQSVPDAPPAVSAGTDRPIPDAQASAAIPKADPAQAGYASATAEPRNLVVPPNATNSATSPAAAPAAAGGTSHTGGPKPPLGPTPPSGSQSTGPLAGPAPGAHGPAAHTSAPTTSVSATSQTSSTPPPPVAAAGRPGTDDEPDADPEEFPTPPGTVVDDPREHNVQKDPREHSVQQDPRDHNVQKKPAGDYVTIPGVSYPLEDQPPADAIPVIPRTPALTPLPNDSVGLGRAFQNPDDSGTTPYPTSPRPPDITNPLSDRHSAAPETNLDAGIGKTPDSLAMPSRYTTEPNSETPGAPQKPAAPHLNPHSLEYSEDPSRLPATGGVPHLSPAPQPKKREGKRLVTRMGAEPEDKPKRRKKRPPPPPPPPPEDATRAPISVPTPGVRSDAENSDNRSGPLHDPNQPRRVTSRETAGPPRDFTRIRDGITTAYRQTEGAGELHPVSQALARMELLDLAILSKLSPLVRRRVIDVVSAVEKGQELSPLQGDAIKAFVRLLPMEPLDSTGTLTDLELTELRLVAEDKSLREIGVLIGLKETTVRAHLVRIERKLGAEDRVTAVVAAIRDNILPQTLDESADRARSPLPGLTPRETEVLALVADGESSPEIAAQLDISVAAVDSLVERAGEKLGSPTRAGMVAVAVSTDVLPRTTREGDSGQALPELTQREIEVLTLIAKGKTSAEIADDLALTPQTVESYASRINRKLGVGTRAGSVAIVIRTGIIPPIDATASDGAARPELTPREREVLGLVAKGENDNEIAAALGLTRQSVKTYVFNINQKFGTHHRAGMAAFALRTGNLPLMDTAPVAGAEKTGSSGGSPSGRQPTRPDGAADKFVPTDVAPPSRPEQPGGGRQSPGPVVSFQDIDPFASDRPARRRHRTLTGILGPDGLDWGVLNYKNPVTGQLSGMDEPEEPTNHPHPERDKTTPPTDTNGDPVQPAESPLGSGDQPPAGSRVPAEPLISDDEERAHVGDQRPATADYEVQEQPNPGGGTPSARPSRPGPTPWQQSTAPEPGIAPPPPGAARNDAPTTPPKVATPRTRAQSDPVQEAPGTPALVRAARNGDSVAFDRLRADLADPIVQWMSARMAGDRAAAEGLTDEVFTRAAAGIGRLRAEQDIKQWLGVIARNVLVEHRRYERLRDGIWASYAGPRNTESGPQGGLLARADRATVLRAVHQLPSDHQKVLVWRFEQDKTATQIAESMPSAWESRTVRRVERRAAQRVVEMVAAELGVVVGGQSAQRRQQWRLIQDADPVELARHIDMLPERQREVAGLLLPGRAKALGTSPRRLKDTLYQQVVPALATLLAGGVVLTDHEAVMLTRATQRHDPAVLAPYAPGLDPLHQKTFEQFFMQRRTVNEMAAAEGSKPKTIYMRVYRVARFMAQKVPRELIESYANRGLLQSATTHDVAREAGVSQSTAEKVLRGAGEFAPETKRRVLEAADRVGHTFVQREGVAPPLRVVGPAELYRYLGGDAGYRMTRYEANVLFESAVRSGTPTVGDFSVRIPDASTADGRPLFPEHQLWQMMPPHVQRFRKVLHLLSDVRLPDGRILDSSTPVLIEQRPLGAVPTDFQFDRLRAMVLRSMEGLRRALGEVPVEPLRQWLPGFPEDRDTEGFLRFLTEQWTGQVLRYRQAGWAEMFTDLEIPGRDPFAAILEQAIFMIPARFEVLHGRLGRENIRIDRGRITAITGWAGALIGDPAFDWAWLNHRGAGDYVPSRLRPPNVPIYESLLHVRRVVHGAVELVAQGEPDPNRIAEYAASYAIVRRFWGLPARDPGLLRDIFEAQRRRLAAEAAARTGPRTGQLENPEGAGRQTPWSGGAPSAQPEAEPLARGKSGRPTPWQRTATSPRAPERQSGPTAGTASPDAPPVPVRRPAQPTAPVGTVSPRDSDEPADSNSDIEATDAVDLPCAVGAFADAWDLGFDVRQPVDVDGPVPAAAVSWLAGAHHRRFDDGLGEVAQLMTDLGPGAGMLVNVRPVGTAIGHLFLLHNDGKHLWIHDRQAAKPKAVFDPGNLPFAAQTTHALILTRRGSGNTLESRQQQLGEDIAPADPDMARGRALRPVDAGALPPEDHIDEPSTAATPISRGRPSNTTLELMHRYLDAVQAADGQVQELLVEVEQRIPDTGERAYVQRFAENERRAAALAEELGIPLDRLRTLMAEELRKIFDGEIVTRVNSGSLRGILESGRFKTEFDFAGQSRMGRSMLAGRVALEQALFGYPPDLPAQSRPIYGFIRTAPSYWVNAGDALAQYGDIDVVFKPAVEERTTANAGDTKSVVAIPSKVTDPQPESFAATPHGHKTLGYMGLEGIDRDYTGKRFTGSTYIEAQVHGATVADIDYVVFHVSPPDEHLRQLLDAAGIPWSHFFRNPSQPSRSAQAAGRPPTAAPEAKASEPETPNRESALRESHESRTPTTDAEPEDSANPREGSEPRQAARNVGLIGHASVPPWNDIGGADAFSDGGPSYLGKPRQIRKRLRELGELQIDGGGWVPGGGQRRHSRMDPDEAAVAAVRDLPADRGDLNPDLTVEFVPLHAPDGLRTEEDLEAVAMAVADMMRERGWRDRSQIDAATELVRGAGRNAMTYMERYTRSLQRRGIEWYEEQTAVQDMTARLTLRMSTQADARSLYVSFDVDQYRPQRSPDIEMFTWHAPLFSHAEIGAEVRELLDPATVSGVEQWGEVWARFDEPRSEPSGGSVVDPPPRGALEAKARIVRKLYDDHRIRFRGWEDSVVPVRAVESADRALRDLIAEYGGRFALRYFRFDDEIEGFGLTQSFGTTTPDTKDYYVTVTLNSKILTDPEFARAWAEQTADHRWAESAEDMIYQLTHHEFIHVVADEGNWVLHHLAPAMLRAAYELYGELGLIAADFGYTEWLALLPHYSLLTFTDPVTNTFDPVEGVAEGARAGAVESSLPLTHPARVLHWLTVTRDGSSPAEFLARWAQRQASGDPDISLLLQDFRDVTGRDDIAIPSRLRPGDTAVEVLAAATGGQPQHFADAAEIEARLRAWDESSGNRGDGVSALVVPPERDPYLLVRRASPDGTTRIELRSPVEGVLRANHVPSAGATGPHGARGMFFDETGAAITVPLGSESGQQGGESAALHPRHPIKGAPRTPDGEPDAPGGLDPATNPVLAAVLNPAGDPAFDRMKAEHFPPVFEYAMRMQLAAIDEIVGAPGPWTADNALRPFARSGLLLGAVKQLFAQKAAVDRDPATAEAEPAVAELQDAHANRILTDPALAEIFRYLHEHRSDLDLSDTEFGYLERKYQDFQNAGAYLSTDQEKRRLSELNSEIAVLQTGYKDNQERALEDIEIRVDDAGELRGLTGDQIESARSRAGEDSGYLLPKPPSVSGVWYPYLTYLDDPALRQRIYEKVAALATVDHDNSQNVLDQVRKLAERAEITGKNNHAEYVMSSGIFDSVATVRSILDRIARAAATAARVELPLLAEAIGTEQIQPWDRYRALDVLIGRRVGIDEQMIREFFELDRVLENGVFRVAEDLFELTITELVEHGKPPVWHEDVRVFAVLDKEGQHLTNFYFDPYARKGKNGGEWTDPIRLKFTPTGQRPLISVHLNLEKPPAGKPTLLAPIQVDTLFHEFGHALHFLLGAGTHEPAKRHLVFAWIEFVAKVFQQFWKHPDVVQNYAVHHRTGEPMPPEMLEKLDEWRTAYRGTVTVFRLAGAYIDLGWNSLSSAQVPFGRDPRARVQEFEEAILTQAGIRFSEIGNPYPSQWFRHLFAQMGAFGTYSGQYWSYLLSDVLALIVFGLRIDPSIEQHGGLTPETGKIILDEILRYEENDLAQATRRLIGPQPALEHFLSDQRLLWPEALLELGANATPQWLTTPAERPPGTDLESWWNERLTPALRAAMIQAFPAEVLAMDIALAPETVAAAEQRRRTLLEYSRDARTAAAPSAAQTTASNPDTTRGTNSPQRRSTAQQTNPFDSHRASGTGPAGMALDIPERKAWDIGTVPPPRRRFDPGMVHAVDPRLGPDAWAVGRGGRRPEQPPAAGESAGNASVSRPAAQPTPRGDEIETTDHHENGSRSAGQPGARENTGGGIRITPAGLIVPADPTNSLIVPAAHVMPADPSLEELMERLRPWKEIFSYFWEFPMPREGSLSGREWIESSERKAWMRRRAIRRAPLYAGVDAAVRLTLGAERLLMAPNATPGPATIRQRRVIPGRGEIDAGKKRTMHADAEVREANRADVEEMTPFEKFWRRVSGDELPQTKQIRQGELAYVGGRLLRAEGHNLMVAGRYAAGYNLMVAGRDPVLTPEEYALWLMFSHDALWTVHYPGCRELESQSPEFLLTRYLTVAIFDKIASKPLEVQYLNEVVRPYLRRQGAAAGRVLLHELSHHLLDSSRSTLKQLGMRNRRGFGRKAETEVEEYQDNCAACRNPAADLPAAGNPGGREVVDRPLHATESVQTATTGIGDDADESDPAETVFVVTFEAVLSEYPALRELLPEREYRHLGGDEGEEMPSELARPLHEAGVRYGEKHSGSQKDVYLIGDYAVLIPEPSRTSLDFVLWPDEYQTLRAIAEVALPGERLPVPQVLHVERDSDGHIIFAIQRRIYGEPVTNVFDDELRSAMSTLAQLFTRIQVQRDSLPLRKGSLRLPADYPESGDSVGFFRMMMEYLERVYRHYREIQPYRVAFDELRLSESVVESLEQMVGELRSQPFRVLHADITTANVLRTTGGGMIVDFGLALYGPPDYEAAVARHRAPGAVDRDHIPLHLLPYFGLLAVMRVLLDTIRLVDEATSPDPDADRIEEMAASVALALGFPHRLQYGVTRAMPTYLQIRDLADRLIQQTAARSGASTSPENDPEEPLFVVTEPDEPVYVVTEPDEPSPTTAPDNHAPAVALDLPPQRARGLDGLVFDPTSTVSDPFRGVRRGLPDGVLAHAGHPHDPEGGAMGGGRSEAERIANAALSTFRAEATFENLQQWAARLSDDHLDHLLVGFTRRVTGQIAAIHRGEPPSVTDSVINPARLLSALVAEATRRFGDSVPPTAPTTYAELFALGPWLQAQRRAIGELDDAMTAVLDATYAVTRTVAEHRWSVDASHHTIPSHLAEVGLRIEEAGRHDIWLEEDSFQPSAAPTAEHARLAESFVRNMEHGRTMARMVTEWAGLMNTVLRPQSGKNFSPRYTTIFQSLPVHAVALERARTGSDRLFAATAATALPHLLDAAFYLLPTSNFTLGLDYLRQVDELLTEVITRFGNWTVIYSLQEAADGVHRLYEDITAACSRRSPEVRSRRIHETLSEYFDIGSAPSLAHWFHWGVRALWGRGSQSPGIEYALGEHRLDRDLPWDWATTDDERALAATAVDLLRIVHGRGAEIRSLLEHGDAADLFQTAFDIVSKNMRWWIKLRTWTGGNTPIGSLLAGATDFSVSQIQLAVLRQYPHIIGAAAGIPYRARDLANRLSLARDLKSRRVAPERRRELAALREQLAEVRNMAYRLPVDASPPPPVLLVSYDPVTQGGTGRAVVSIGEADHASFMAFNVTAADTPVTDLAYWADHACLQYEVAQQHAPRNNRISIMFTVGLPRGFEAPSHSAGPDPTARGNVIEARDVAGDIVARELMIYDATREIALDSRDESWSRMVRLSTVVGHGDGIGVLRSSAETLALSSAVDQIVLVPGSADDRLLTASQLHTGTERVYTLNPHRDRNGDPDTIGLIVVGHGADIESAPEAAGRSTAPLIETPTTVRDLTQLLSAHEYRPLEGSRGYVMTDDEGVAVYRAAQPLLHDALTGTYNTTVVLEDLGLVLRIGQPDTGSYDPRFGPEHRTLPVISQYVRNAPQLLQVITGRMPDGRVVDGSAPILIERLARGQNLAETFRRADRRAIRSHQDLILRTFANIHGQLRTIPENHPLLDQLTPPGVTKGDTGGWYLNHIDWYVENFYRRHLDRFGHLFDEFGLLRGNPFEPLIDDARSMRESRHHILHADPNEGNFLISNELRVTLLDWELAVNGPSAYDWARLDHLIPGIEVPRAFGGPDMVKFARVEKFKRVMNDTVKLAPLAAAGQLTPQLIEFIETEFSEAVIQVRQLSGHTDLLPPRAELEILRSWRP